MPSTMTLFCGQSRLAAIVQVEAVHDLLAPAGLGAAVDAHGGPAAARAQRGDQVQRGRAAGRDHAAQALVVQDAAQQRRQRRQLACARAARACAW